MKSVGQMRSACLICQDKLIITIPQQCAHTYSQPRGITKMDKHILGYVTSCILLIASDISLKAQFNIYHFGFSVVNAEQGLGPVIEISLLRC